MLAPAEVDACANLLAQAYSSNTWFADFPVDTSSLSVAEAANIQNKAASLIGADVIGWKVGYANEAKRREHGESAPVWGRLFEGAVLSSPAVLKRADVGNPIVEGEWVVRLGEDLPARDVPYTSEEITGAIGAVMPAIEFADPRLSRPFSVVELLAINAGAFRVLLGPEVPNWQQANINELDAELIMDGECHATAYHDDQRSDPVWSLRHLANLASRRGVGLSAGQVVSTGVILPLFRLGSGQDIEFRVAGLDAVKLSVRD